MRQYRFTDCNKYTTPVQDDEYGVAVQYGRTEDIWEIFLPSAQSCCELEITRQNEVY